MVHGETSLTDNFHEWIHTTDIISLCTGAPILGSGAKSRAGGRLGEAQRTLRSLESSLLPENLLPKLCKARLDKLAILERHPPVYMLWTGTYAYHRDYRASGCSLNGFYVHGHWNDLAQHCGASPSVYGRGRGCSYTYFLRPKRV